MAGYSSGHTTGIVFFFKVEWWPVGGEVVSESLRWGRVAGFCPLAPQHVPVKKSPAKHDGKLVHRRRPVQTAARLQPFLEEPMRIPAAHQSVICGARAVSELL
jgi:hypothetical protein